jgi:hypothetical protein
MDTRKPIPERRFRPAVGVLSSPHTWRWGARMRLGSAPQREHELREVFNMNLERWVGFAPAPHGATCPTPCLLRGRRSTRAEAAVDKSGPLRGGAPRLARTVLAPFGGPLTRADGHHTRLADPPRVLPPERLSGRLRDGAKPKKGSNKVHAAVDALGDLLALHVSPADEQDSGRLEEEAEAIREASGESVELASYVDLYDTPGRKPSKRRRRPTA